MKFAVSHVHAWAPGIATKEDWSRWKAGDVQIQNEKISPALEFADPLFKRRLSQITRMTIQTIHDVLEERPDCASSKIAFVSFRGELERQLLINKMLLQDNGISPAGFSLSVFNTPVAAASIALHLKSGYSVIYPSRGNFQDALICAASPVLCGEEQNIIFVYADEKIPGEYSGIAPGGCLPFSFAAVFSRPEEANRAVEISLEHLPQSPQDFLKETVLSEE